MAFFVTSKGHCVVIIAHKDKIRISIFVFSLTDTQLHISSRKDHVFSAHKTHNYLRPEATGRLAIATGEIRA